MAELGRVRHSWRSYSLIVEAIAIAKFVRCHHGGFLPQRLLLALELDVSRGLVIERGSGLRVVVGGQGV